MKTIFIDCNQQLGAVWQRVYRNDDPPVTINTTPFEKNELPRVVGDYDIGMVVTFRDEASMKAYLVDPRHVQLVKEVLEPLADMSKTKVYDFVNHE